MYLLILMVRYPTLPQGFQPIPIGAGPGLLTRILVAERKPQVDKKRVLMAATHIPLTVSFIISISYIVHFTLGLDSPRISKGYDARQSFSSSPAIVCFCSFCNHFQSPLILTFALANFRPNFRFISEPIAIRIR